MGMGRCRETFSCCGFAFGGVAGFKLVFCSAKFCWTDVEGRGGGRISREALSSGRCPCFGCHYIGECYKELLCSCYLSRRSGRVILQTVMNVW